MPIQTGEELIEFHKNKSNLTDEQCQFMLRIIKLIYQAFPDLDDLNKNSNGWIRCTVLAEGVDLTNFYGTRAFNFKSPTTAYYYQAQMGNENMTHEEEPKEFSLFTDEEILTHLKRKRFPREKKGS